MAYNGHTDVYVTDFDTLSFAWSQQSQSIENNSTTIYWELVLYSYSHGAIVSPPLKSGAVYINDGGNINHSASVDIGNNTYKILATGTKTITHNSDGKKTFSYSFYQSFDITFSGVWIGTVSGSGTGVLNDIPRQATILTAPNFTDESNPTITYSNPAGNSVSELKACISFSGAADISYRPIPKTGSSYTFNLTDAERKALRDATSHVKSIDMTFYVTSVIGGKIYYSTLKRKLTIVDSLPTLNPVVEDYGSISYALTNDRNVIIKGCNYPKATFNAVANKGASIASKSVTCLGKHYTESPDGTCDGYFVNVESGTFVFSVTDTRGLTTKKTVTKTLVNYFKPTITLDSTIIIDSSTNTAGVDIKVSGKCYSGTFGNNGERNTLIGYYRFKTNDNSYCDWKKFEISVLDNLYDVSKTLSTSSDTPEAFNIGDKITLQFALSDRVNSDVYNTETGNLVSNAIYVTKQIIIQPVFDWSKNDFAFHVPVTMPKLYVKDISLGGGELIGYGCIYNSTPQEAISTGTIKSWSDLNAASSGPGNSYELYVDETIMDFDSGTFRIFPKNIIGMVEVEVFISGFSSSHCYGLWWRDNSNELPKGVSMLGFSSSNNLGALSYLPQNCYGTASHKYVYEIDRSTVFSSDISFYANPRFSPYRYSDTEDGTFVPNSGGVKSYMIVKIYSKRGV